MSQEKLCLSCHLDDPEVRSRIAPSAGFIDMYEHSVHGSQLNAGNSKAANCVDCHNSHDVIEANLAESSIFHSNIPYTCSQCHEEIFNDYKESVHSKALLRGNSNSPIRLPRRA